MQKRGNLVTTRYELNTPDVMAEDFDADLVLLNLRSGEYFNITGAARAFLDTVLDGVCPASLSTVISQTAPKSGAETALYFENLQKHNLVRPIKGATALDATAAQAAAILAIGVSFPFECFTDLSDLLAADPIHDVAPEAGWPIMPDAG